MSSHGTVSLDMSDVHPTTADDAMSQELPDMDDLKLEDIVTALANRVTRTKLESEAPEEAPKQSGILPKHILFPFSRHSSYGELCSLIEAFKPKDIFPCTTVPEKYWKANHSMAYLFGHLYTEPPKFRHDQTMFRKLAERPAPTVSPRVQKKMNTPDVTPSSKSFPPSSSSPSKKASKRKGLAQSQDGLETSTPKRRITDEPSRAEEGKKDDDEETDEEMDCTELSHAELAHAELDEVKLAEEVMGEDAMDETELKNAFRLEASNAALGNGGKHWSTIGLVSVSNHQEKEEEL